MKHLLLMIMLVVTFSTFAQNAEKMKKNFHLNVTKKFDPSLTISFDHTVEGKHGFDVVDQYFRSGFHESGFNVTDTNSRYKVMMDYKYGYAIATYKMQYSDLIAEIIDTETKEIVGSFNYKGRYDNDYIGPAIGKAIKEAVDKMVK